MASTVGTRRAPTRSNSVISTISSKSRMRRLTAGCDNPQHDYTKRLMAAVPIADPTRRQVRRISNEEIGSPFRTIDYRPPKRTYAQAGDGHFVQVR